MRAVFPSRSHLVGWLARNSKAHREIYCLFCIKIYICLGNGLFCRVPHNNHSIPWLMEFLWFVNLFMGQLMHEWSVSALDLHVGLIYRNGVRLHGGRCVVSTAASSWPEGAISLFIQSSRRLIASRGYRTPLTLMRHVIYRGADYSLSTPARARAATRRPPLTSPSPACTHFTNALHYAKSKQLCILLFCITKYNALHQHFQYLWL